jgi:hypothetical protein
VSLTSTYRKHCSLYPLHFDHAIARQVVDQLAVAAAGASPCHSAAADAAGRGRGPGRVGECGAADAPDDEGSPSYYSFEGRICWRRDSSRLVGLEVVSIEVRRGCFRRNWIFCKQDSDSLCSYICCKVNSYPTILQLHNVPTNYA